MREILLTKGRVAMVDDDDYDRLSRFNWCLFEAGKYIYAYRRVDKHTTMKMHREIMDAPKGMVVDHINHDGLDNRRSNLRVCTQSENVHHRRGRQPNNTTGYPGVVWVESRKHYIAQIQVMSKHKYLGSYRTAEDAHRAYCAASKKYFGEFSPVK